MTSLWLGQLPTAEELEKLWLQGRLPPGILPPITILKKYSEIDDDEYELNNDEIDYVASL